MVCAVCGGEGHLTPDELSRSLARMVEQVASFTGDDLDLDPGLVGLARFEEAVLARPRETDEPTLADPADSQDELRSANEAEGAEQASVTLRAEQQKLRRYGPDLYHLLRSGQVTQSEVEQALRRRQEKALLE